MARRLLLAFCFMTVICGQAFSVCSAPQNKIEAENCLPGNDSSQWSVAGSGDSTIQGFATDMSVNAGQTINFKIKTTATAYTIGIFRIGYYGGLGARKVASITPSATLPQSQPACLTDATTSLYDCGNWGISASWLVPSNALSGVYLAVLIRPDTGGASQIVFVVRNDSSTSDMVFETADETWQAYNPYGGHSLYGGNATFDLTNRAYKVSYNRPFNSLNLESESWIMYAEYPMIRWLEANGYDVTYISSVDGARNGGLIKNHKLYLSVGHDEYVSGLKRASVEAARDKGVNLAFFSGNEFFWKTRWENSIDSTNTPYRTLVCFKETLGPNSNPTATAAVDPLDPPTWTGTWRDLIKSPPADGGRPENALTGQLFRVNGPGTDNTDLSIKVPAPQGKMRFWRNTQVAAQSAGQTWTLPAGTLGYEWDVEEDNGFRPAGLFDLSTATYNLTTDYLQDYGGVYGAGTATHHMSMYRAPSGALVFGAGTVQWSFGLDFNNGLGLSADPNMQQATVNLFADMGVQPVSIQPGLLPAAESSDTTPPISTITSPTSGAVVQAGTTITVTGTAIDSGGGLVAGVEVSVNGGTTWHPASGTTSWSYTWTSLPAGTFSILSRAVDDSANIETPSAGVGVNIVGVSSITLQPSTLSGGNSSQATVTLSAPAGTGGITVTLTNSTPQTATVPNSVLVPAGSNSATFNVSTKVVAVPTAVTITATYASTSGATLIVNPVFPPPPGTVNVDADVSTHQGTSSTTITSGAFSTVASNELVLALVSSDALQPNLTVTGVAGGGLTWNLVVRTNAQGGTSEIWRALAPSVLSNVTATATFSASSPAASITIMTFAGVDTSGTNGSGAIGNTASNSSAEAAPTASLTTTRNNSWVLGVGDDYTSAIARIVGSNQTLIDQDLTPTGDTLWSQRQNMPTPTSGTNVTINDTAPSTDSFNLAIVEVRPPVVGPYTISGNLSASGSNATVTLSGAMAQTITADGSGNYTVAGLIAGSYTVTPSKVGYAFSPASQSLAISTSSMSNVNFTANPTFSISGNITPSASGSGATLALNGASSGTATADSSGNYTFNGLVNGTYTITPSRLGFGFTPASQTVMVSGANTPNINFTAAAQNYSISGNLSPNGANASVALSGAATANVTADGSGNYSFTGLGNGAYTVTPSKAGCSFNPTTQNTTVSGGPITGLNFTAQVVATTNLAIDAKVSTDGTAASSSISSSPFTTASGNELLLAFVATDYLGGANTTVSNVTGAGLTWTLAVRSNGQSGGSEIWRAFAATPVTNATVTASLSQSVVSSITVMSFIGTNISGGIGATTSKSAATGAPSVSLTTTRNNSWIFGIGNDFDNAIGRTPSTGQSLVHQYLTSAGDTYWVQMQTSTTPLSGTIVSISDTAPTTDRWNLAAIEVLPILGAFSISGSVTPAQAGVTMSLSGTTTSSTVTDASGNYTFTGLGNGPYTVTPSKSGTAFSPTSQTVAVTNGDIPAVNFTAIGDTWSISGNVSANGASANVALSGTASASSTADSSGNYSFSGLANGIYTVTPSKSGFTFNPTSQNVTLNNGNVSSLNFTATSSGSTGLAIDANVSTDGTTAKTTISTPAFSTKAANELLVAFVATDYLSGTNTTVTSIAGGGLNWALVKRTNVQSGGAEIWAAFASTAITNVTITATVSQSVVSSITLISFTGVDTSSSAGIPNAIGATGTGNSGKGAPTTSLVTTRNKSWVLGVGNDYDNAINRTPGTGQTVVHQFLTSTGDTYWVQMQTATTPLSGTSVTINDTAPSTDRYNLSTVEVRTP